MSAKSEKYNIVKMVSEVAQAETIFWKWLEDKGPTQVAEAYKNIRWAEIVSNYYVNYPQAKLSYRQKVRITQAKKKLKNTIDWLKTGRFSSKS